MHVAQDGLWDINFGNGVANYEDSCCLLDYEIDFFDANQCGGRKRFKGERTGNTTAPGASGDAAGDAARGTNSGKTDPGVPNSRKLQQAGQGAAAPTYGDGQSYANTAYDAGTANYGYENGYSSGTYYQGTATVVWGTFYATNAHTGEEWEEEGKWRARLCLGLRGSLQPTQWKTKLSTL